MAINPYARIDSEPLRPPVTLPAFKFKNGNVEQEVREDQQHRAAVRTIKAGQEAWSQITKAETFEAWARIGAALAIGKAIAMRATGVNQAWGRNYSRVFGDWMKQHRFDRMPKSTRSTAIELHENVAAIEQWRATLPERQRRRLKHPLSNVRAWRQATAPKKTCSDDRVKVAGAAWRRFVALMEALPADQAAPLWQAARKQCGMAAFTDFIAI